MMVGLPWVQMPCGHSIVCNRPCTLADVDAEISTHRAQCQTCNAGDEGVER